MSEQQVGTDMKIRCPDGSICEGLRLMFDGQRASFCDCDGHEHQMSEFLGGTFDVTPVQAAIIMRKLRG